MTDYDSTANRRTEDFGFRIHASSSTQGDRDAGLFRWGVLLRGYVLGRQYNVHVFTLTQNGQQLLLGVQGEAGIVDAGLWVDGGIEEIEASNVTVVSNRSCHQLVEGCEVQSTVSTAFSVVSCRFRHQYATGLRTFHHVRVVRSVVQVGSTDEVEQVHVFCVFGDQAVFGLGLLEQSQEQLDVFLVDVHLVDHTDGRWDAVDGRSVPSLEQNVVGRNNAVSTGVDHTFLISEVNELLTLDGLFDQRGAELVRTFNERDAVQLSFRFFCGDIIDRSARLGGRSRKAYANQVAEAARRGNLERMDRVHGRLSAVDFGSDGTYLGVECADLSVFRQQLHNPTSTVARDLGGFRNLHAQLGELERLVHVTFVVDNFVCNRVQPEHQGGGLSIVGNETLHHHAVAFTIYGVDENSLVVGELGTVVEGLGTVRGEEAIPDNQLRQKRPAFGKDEHVRQVRRDQFRRDYRSATTLVFDA
ncbi:hypothetical protein D3C78_87550 [compost metagenome]